VNVDPIADFLAAVRGRLRRRQALGSAATFGAVALAVPLAIVLAAGALGPGPVWRPLAILGAVALVAAAAALVVRARQSWASDDHVARFVGGRAAEVGDELLSAVELGRARAALAGVASTALVDAHRARVVERLKRVQPSRLVDFRPERRRGAVRVGGAALAWLLVAALAPGMLRRGWDGLRQARPDQVATSAEPIVGDLKIELDYPPYTGLEPRVIPASSGHVVALPGTDVKLEARALVPTREARLVIDEDGAPASQQPEVAPVEVRAGGVLATHFVARKPGRYRFVLEGAGRRVREPDTHRIDLEPDRAPRVDLYAPAENLEVAGPRRVEIGWSIDDDYGLGDVELVWRIGSAPEARRVIQKAPPAPGKRSSAGKYEWDLAELDLKPGVRVAYHLEAKDNDVVSGPNVGASRTFYLSMFSPREKQEQTLASEEQLLEGAIALLADRLEAKRGDDAELVDAFGRIHNGAEALLLAFARAERALEASTKESDGARKLREMHARLGKLTSEEEQLLAELRRRRAPGRHALEAGNARHVTELERDVLALDDLLGRQRLEELLAVGDEMTQARDRLKSLLDKYKHTRSDAVRKDIERELRELERKLAELQAKAAKLASELPDQFLNAEAMGKNDMASELQRIREQLARGDVDGAMAALEKLSKSLDGMVASMEGDLRGFRRERFSAEDKAMAELEDKLSDLAHDERQLKADTEAVQKRTRAEAQRLLRDKIEPLARRAREKVAQLRKQLEQVEPGAVPPYDLEELQRIKQRVDDLERGLQSGDVDEARHAAHEADHGLAALGADLRDEEARMFRGGHPGTKRARERTDDAEKTARQIAEELDRAMPQPGELMSPEDQKRMGELAERQQATRRRAQEIARDLKSKTGEGGKPVALPPQVDEGLREAGQHMERAEGELRHRDARDAQGEESQALDKLAKMQEQLQRERRPREQMAGGRLDRETVKIPGADEYRAPKEFRQDLLEAMKRGAPAEYKDQVRRYYEELVK
jgi:Domain of unknown function (DUF4175)